MFEKLLNVFAKNLGYTVVLAVALVVFLIASEGHLIAGLITAVSGLLVYTCSVALYKEYKVESAKKATPVRAAVKKAPAKKAKRK
ncbi:MAG: hypothetical protein IKK76_04170 [Alphaproteobacteria bacterium]|nr:hypothetical protein [Alphaproteobacteria bacterium]